MATFIYRMANMSKILLEIKNLSASTAEDSKQILKGIDLVINEGELHAIMGPNGSGKSTLSNVLLGSPEYVITSGTIKYKGEEIQNKPTEDIAKSGIFLGFQYPQEIPGVSVLNFMRQALSARKGIEMSILELRLSLMEWIERIGIDESFLDRYLNEGFSGGEKKRNEILQMAVLEPDLAILDETDSGLDIDSLRIVAEGINTVRSERPQLGVLAITHYQRLLDYLKPDYVHILQNGKIIKSGGIEIATELEKVGYEGNK